MEDGEVRVRLDDEVTKPLPITKVRNALGKFWPDMLFPLTVLYSPLLRLRFRSALCCCCNQVNLATHRIVFSTPVEAPNRLAVEMEQFKVEPPLGSVYVKNCECRSATDGLVDLFQDCKEVIVSGIVKLPESEENPYTTLGVTMHVLGHLLGLTHSDDPGSIMYTNAKVRPQILSD